MPPVGFEPTISAGERPQTYALDRAATGTGKVGLLEDKYLSKWHFAHHKSHMDSPGKQPGHLLVEVLQPFTIVAHIAHRDKQNKIKL